MNGTVQGFSEGLVIVRPEKCAACFGCLKGGCGGDRLITAENRDGLPLAPGRRVEIRDPFPVLFGQAAAALFPPVLGFAGGAGIAVLLGLGEGGRAALGVLGFFIAGALVYLIQKRFPPRVLPGVCRVLPDLGQAQENNSSHGGTEPRRNPGEKA